MRSSNEAYPYPILSDDHQGMSYEQCAFQCALKVEKIETNLGQWDAKIKANFLNSNTAIKNLIEKKQASYGINVICTLTGFRELILLDKPYEHQFPLHSFYGKVEFHPLIVITQKVNNFSSNQLKKEYLYQDKNGNDVYPQFDLNPGDLIAHCEIHSKYFHYEPKAISSLIRAKQSKDIPDYIYKIDTSANDILNVLMGEQLYKLWNGKGQDYLRVAVIKDCVLMAMDDYRIDKSAFADKKWGTFLTEIFEEFSIDEHTSIVELNIFAQQVAEKYGVKMIERKVKA